MAGLVPIGVVVPSTSAAAAVAVGALTDSVGRQNGGGTSATATSTIGSVNQRSITASSLHRYSSERIPIRKASAAVQPIACSASVNEVVVENHVGSSSKPGKANDTKQADSPTESSSESSISTFLKDVTDLIKLVDSKDIVELELKSSEYEIVIRKESPQPPPFPGPFPGPQVMAHTSIPGYAPPLPSGSPPPQAPASTPAEVPPPPPPTKPSHPPMLSPMAGTFYRSPGPGAPAYVQVGDKVRKGQVVCIVEAMKLMNEIEADQSGTIVEILAEDGKPLSIESPLFSIKP